MRVIDCGWLLLKCSTIGIEFNGTETNCGIAHILVILLMNSYDIQIILATTICFLSKKNSLTTLAFKASALLLISS